MPSGPRRSLQCSAGRGPHVAARPSVSSKSSRATRRAALPDATHLRPGRDLQAFGDGARDRLPGELLDPEELPPTGSPRGTPGRPQASRRSRGSRSAGPSRDIRAPDPGLKRLRHVETGVPNLVGRRQQRHAPEVDARFSSLLRVDAAAEEAPVDVGDADVGRFLHIALKRRRRVAQELIQPSFLLRVEDLAEQPLPARRAPFSPAPARRPHRSARAISSDRSAPQGRARGDRLEQHPRIGSGRAKCAHGIRVVRDERCPGRRARIVVRPRAVWTWCSSAPRRAHFVQTPSTHSMNPRRNAIASFATKALSLGLKCFGTMGRAILRIQTADTARLSIGPSGVSITPRPAPPSKLIEGRHPA